MTSFDWKMRRQHRKKQAVESYLYPQDMLPEIPCQNGPCQRRDHLSERGWCTRLESRVQFAIMLQLCGRSFHGIYQISPVKIQNLLSIQLWWAAWCSIKGKSTVVVGSGSLPSANDFLNTSWLPGSIARLTCLAMVRNEEGLGLKPSC